MIVRLGAIQECVRRTQFRLGLHEILPVDCACESFTRSGVLSPGASRQGRGSGRSLVSQYALLPSSRERVFSPERNPIPRFPFWELLFPKNGIQYSIFGNSAL